MSGALLLFGAGASFGSDEPQYVPPMGDALFDALSTFAPSAWGAIPAAQRALFVGDFERGMTALAESHPHALPPLQRAMAAFFYKFKPRFAGLYYKLGERIKVASWNGAIATLNYECMLPMALDSAGVTITCGKSDSSGVEVCLPHGICNLFVEGIRAHPSVSMHGTGARVGVGLPVRFIYDDREFYERINGDAIPPVMSYFEPLKHTMAGGHFIEQQRGRFAELVRSAGDIIVVGMRVRERDEHIWRPLADSPARIAYCGGAAGKEFQEWAARARPGRDSIDLGGRFAERYDAICKYAGIP